MYHWLSYIIIYYCFFVIYSQVLSYFISFYHIWSCFFMLCHVFHMLNINYRRLFSYGHLLPYIVSLTHGHILSYLYIVIHCHVLSYIYMAIYSCRAPHCMFERLCTCLYVCLWSMCADTVLHTWALFAEHSTIAYGFTVMRLWHIENFRFHR